MAKARAGAWIHEALRTPRGKARKGGGLAHQSPHGLVGHLINCLDERTSGAARHTDAMALGCVGQVGAQGGHIAHISKLHAGLPDKVHALSINNFCASGLSAIGHAAALIETGRAQSVLAGGVEMMSRVPFLGDDAAYYSDPEFPQRARFVPVALAADRLATHIGVDRDALDAASFQSNARAAAADTDPRFQASRVAVDGFDRDECIRPASRDSLKSLPPAFASLQTDFADALGGPIPALHSLAHAPPICDGAGLSLIGTKVATAKPRARILAYAESGGDPWESLTAGFVAMEKALAHAGLSLDAIDRIEFMEAFAVTIVTFLRRYAVDPDRVNVTGGHLAKGHPMGASGAILVSTLLDCLDEADGRYGLAVVCGASGVGAALVVERSG